MPSPTFVFVLGMHRSGTSCLAGVMEGCGVFLGEVGRTDRHNAKGNHEHEPARLLDDQILQQGGGSWSRPPVHIGVSEDQRSAMAAILGVLSRRSPSGLKDPRMLLVLDAWIAAAGDPLLVGTYRHPGLVAASLARRNQIDREQACALWLRYNQALVDRHKRRPFPIIAYDLSDPEVYCATATRVARQLGLLPDVERIRRFVSAELDHGRALDAPLPDSCRALWEYLESVREPWAEPGAETPLAARASGRAVLHLVSGPTCAGKSVYIARHVGQGETVLLPDKGLQEAVRGGGRFLVHYDLLRPFDKSTPAAGESVGRRLRRRLRRLRRSLRGPFSLDHRLRELVSLAADKQAIVLVVPRRDLLARIAARRAQEPQGAEAEARHDERTEALARQVDLQALYRDWLAFLRRVGIPYQLVDARDEHYRPIADERALDGLVARGD